MSARHVLVLAEWHDHLIRYGIGRYAAAQGWRLTVSDGRDGLARWPCDGVLALAGERPGLARDLRHVRVPCVRLGALGSCESGACVQSDYLAIGRLATDHLAERGFARAVCLTCSPTPAPAAGDRLAAGFASRFAEATGCAVRRLTWAGGRAPRLSAVEGRSLAKWLAREVLALAKPAAVFCFSDADAARVEDACLDAGLRVPEEVAILGLGNDTLVCEHVRVPLSSVRENRVKVGFEGAALLDRLMRGEGAPSESVRVPPRGVELRASTDAFGSADPVVRSALAYFRENLGHGAGAGRAAAAVGLSRRQLDERFAQALQLSAHASLMRIRLLEARRLLAQTDEPVKAVAAKAGFCHTQHLCNSFRRVEGCSPLAYRRRQKRQAGVV